MSLMQVSFAIIRNVAHFALIQVTECMVLMKIESILSAMVHLIQCKALGLFQVTSCVQLFIPFLILHSSSKEMQHLFQGLQCPKNGASGPMGSDTPSSNIWPPCSCRPHSWGTGAHEPSVAFLLEGSVVMFWRGLELSDGNESCIVRYKKVLCQYHLLDRHYKELFTWPCIERWLRTSIHEFPAAYIRMWLKHT